MTPPPPAPKYLGTKGLENAPLSAMISGNIPRIVTQIDPRFSAHYTESQAPILVGITIGVA